jgi:uncharacterized membrane protein YgcG
MIAAVITAVIAVAMPLLVSAPARADVQDFEFESLHSDYTLGRDSEGFSTLRTVETFVVLYPDFDQNRGLVRAIPTHYETVDTELVVISVTDENGTAVPYSLEDDGEFLLVVIGTDEFVHGRTTYVIEYQQEHVVRPFADRLNPHQEFYWDVNGTGWAQPFLSVSADVHLADGVADGLNGDVACYQGYEGTSDPCASSTETEGVFHFESSALGPSQNLSFAIGFVDGTFHPEATPRDNPIVAVLPWALLGLLGLVLIGILWLRLVYWRNAPGRGTVIAQYEAPENIGIMESAHLLDRGHTAIPAEIVNLTVQRAVQLVEDAERPLDDRYKLVLVDAAAAEDRDDDSAIRSLFLSTTPGTAIDLDRRSRKLGDRVAALTAQARNNIRTRGFLVRKKSRLAGWLRFFAFVIGAAAIAIGFWADNNRGGSPLLSLQNTVLIVVSILCFGFSGAPERRSQKGSEALEHLQGIRLYLTVAEEDRIRMLQSPTGAERTRVDPNDPAAVVKLYEKLLPFAIIWGVEDQWSKTLGERYATTPVADDTLTRSLALHNLASFSRGYTSSSFATTPPVTSSSSWSGSGGSSFSGGSSGGGSSGGGGGGGGGGGR